MGRRNVLLITIDCLRADQLSCMGYSKKTTPHLDRFSKKGVLFKQAIAQGPLTRPSFQSILTSTYPLMYGGYERLSEKRISIAEVLKKEGYKTGAFHSNPWLSSFFGYNRGFEAFEDSLAKGQTKRYKAAFEEELEKVSEKLHSLIKKIFSLKHKISSWISPGKKRHYIPADKITKKAMSWIEDNQGEDFFVWLHYMDPHHPHLPIEDCMDFYNQPLDQEKIINIQQKNRTPHKLTDKELELMIDLYDGEIRYVDLWINKLLNKLKDLGISDETLKIVTADHGKHFIDRGNSSFVRLYDETIHVPLIIDAGKDFGSDTIEQQVELLDIPPTILEYLNLEKPDKFMGENLLPLLNNDSWEEKYAFSEVVVGAENEDKKVKGDIQRSCRTPNWKCVLDEKTKNFELYNLKKDPNETFDFSEEKDNKAEKFLTEIKKHEKREKEIEEGTEKRRIKRKIQDLKV